jgi:hypothetical protein
MEFIKRMLTNDNGGKNILLTHSMQIRTQLYRPWNGQVGRLFYTQIRNNYISHCLLVRRQFCLPRLSEDHLFQKYVQILGHCWVSVYRGMRGISMISLQIVIWLNEDLTPRSNRPYQQRTQNCLAHFGLIWRLRANSALLQRGHE